MSIAAARAQLATALAGLGIPVHTWPPGTVTPPCVVLDWGIPALQPTTSARTMVGLEARIVVNAATGPAAHQRLAELLDAAVPALIGARIQVDQIPAPVAGDEGRTLTATLPVLVATTP